MSRTKHHRHQNRQHPDWSYMKRYECNSSYALGYGRAGRDAAHKEMRQDGNKAIRSELSAGSFETEGGGVEMNKLTETAPERTFIRFHKIVDGMDEIFYEPYVRADLLEAANITIAKQFDRLDAQAGLLDRNEAEIAGLKQRNEGFSQSIYQRQLLLDAANARIAELEAAREVKTPVRTFNWNPRRLGHGEPVACTFKPRAMYNGNGLKPGVESLTGRKMLLIAVWQMKKDDPYPGEWALQGADEETKQMLHGVSLYWIASGDVEVIE